MYLGGSFGFWDNSDDDVASITIAPEIGYNLSQKWSVGMGLEYAYNKVDNVKINGFGLTPYLRFNYVNAGRIKLFLDGGGCFEMIDITDADSFNAWNVGIKPGISIALTERFSLVAHFGFIGYQSADDEIADIYSTLGHDRGWGVKMNGNNLNFGFYYNF